MSRRRRKEVHRRRRKEATVANLTTMTLPVLPLRNGVVFPHMVVTVRIETEDRGR